MTKHSFTYSWSSVVVFVNCQVTLQYRDVCISGRVVPIRAQVTTLRSLGMMHLVKLGTRSSAKRERFLTIGVIPDGDKNGKPHKLRLLYPIASSALGDFGDSKTVIWVLPFCSIHTSISLQSHIFDMMLSFTHPGFSMLYK
ncbi:uncharacterized protein LOC110270461 [Arachis ipaensis]|uniref:uncharacterized protein LOC110270461 n=1 Tax=Arachis ipaensis TaxID=130454 RepID=UPI000A2B7B5A|nr:uncharacterized protein LOC110270461 [Arachis ipaensis]